MHVRVLLFYGMSVPTVSILLKMFSAFHVLSQAIHDDRIFLLFFVLFPISLGITCNNIAYHYLLLSCMRVFLFLL